ncbi:hypothetical protein FFA01_28310 [Frigoribacterium faeni]|uniref:Uncharacterized protein n=1 Tax=Frigoribacterium faeni TaxID=145483 RepID=A0ABQ0USU3_9MICO|nr:hypothetical protein GCM10025699_71450 [Microbacterium flavescens]GEK84522.1 hypothetical protein FFA01_28310 [Frigoribacterium faeni]
MRATSFSRSPASRARREAGTVPIPGTTKPSRVEENAAAVDVVLTTRDLERIAAAFPHGVAVGTRNTEAGMARDRG